jgi:chorismate-pyruvate lyase
MPEKTAPSPAASGKFSLLHPLDQFYAEENQPLPPLNEVEGEAVPEPYRTLLVHQNDMTPTLEKFYGGAIHLDVLGRRSRGEAYFREVILRLDTTNQPVEFGAIKINLDRFSPETRAEILAERLPLGHLLQEHKIPHTSRPSAYLRFASDKLINQMLGLTGARVLYGRRNTLYDPQNHPLAEIVEILPIANK